MNEEKLINLVQNGETDAYRPLVERYQAGVVIHCENIVKNRQTAEDIAQNAFVKAYYSINKFNPAKGAFSTWLYSIATNLAKDTLRKERKKLPLDEAESIPNEASSLNESERAEIQQAVQSLQPPEYSRVIQAYYWEGLRYEDIAKELDVPVGTIGTWMKRAKLQLRKELL